MKKKLIAFCMALFGLCAYAQQGQSAVGVSIGVAPNLESNVSVTNFEIGAKYQYGITDNLRLEGNLDYGFKSNGVGVFTLTGNIEYLFHLSDKFTIYPLAGIGYGHIGVSADAYIPGLDDVVSVSYGESRFLFNVGLGAEYPITDKISVGADIRFQYMKNFSRLPIMVGVTYKF